jgi:bifunctional UDP-N-acetylglucosamine pyrophosphorylase/glucosamine-1-phosphate N-acetyltransferase
VLEVIPLECAGVNSRAELAALEGVWQQARRTAMMEAGVSLIAPETVWFSMTRRSAATRSWSRTWYSGPAVRIGERVRIKAFSHLEGARSRKARGRPLCAAAARHRAGAEHAHRQFRRDEEGEARRGREGQPPHLSRRHRSGREGQYRRRAPSPATYDGFFKYGTSIGAGAFIGSNSALVAPVAIGDGAIVGAGSVITTDVASDSLAVARGKQKGFGGWAKNFRETMQAKKKG